MSAAPKRRSSRYSLRTLFILIAILAIPLSQYPYVWFMRTGERVVSLEPQADSTIHIRPLSDPGIYVPTARFAIALAITMAAFVAWSLLSRQKSSPDQICDHKTGPIEERQEQ